VKASDVIFLEVEDVVSLHFDALADFGGLDGIRDEGLLESAVMAPRGGYYTSLSELAAVYLHGLAKNHPFVDGNKRTAVASAAIFLRAHGFILRLDADTWEAIVLDVATGKVTREELAGLLAAEMGDVVPFE
jgi:death on curing protein